MKLSTSSQPLIKSRSAISIIMHTNILMHSSVDCNVEHIMELDGLACGRWMTQGIVTIIVLCVFVCARARVDTCMRS